jgi:hypothetical protein
MLANGLRNIVLTGVEDHIFIKEILGCDAEEKE